MQTAADTKKKNQQGFTLIEIIAVLVILGILAAVAIPKYQDLQAQARLKGAQGIIAGAMSSASLSYSSQLLQSGTANVDTIVTDCIATEVTGEYALNCIKSGTDVTIEVTSTKGNMNKQTATWKNPS